MDCHHRQRTAATPVLAEAKLPPAETNLGSGRGDAGTNPSTTGRVVVGLNFTLVVDPDRAAMAHTPARRIAVAAFRPFGHYATIRRQ